MNRLRDQAGEDPTSERVLELLRETPPSPRMPDLKRRVWGSIQLGPASGRAASRLPGFKTVTIAVSIVALAGTAGAVISGRWIVPALDGPARSSALGVATPRPDRSRAIRRMPGRVTVQAPAEVANGLSDRATRRASPAAERGAVRSPAAPVRTASAVSRERTEVLDALIALRRDRDPRRAGVLLERYLSAHPRGTLREEALALAIEAADARDDRPAAQHLARSYQAEFPGGRFHPFARSHTESPLEGPPSSN
jgi:hypothetical protein